jgi:hypothetical protein
MAGIHSELEPEVKISLTESWIVASHHPGDGAFVTEFGCVCYQDTYPMYPDVSCMYLARCILMCPVHIHQDTCKIRDTSRYMQDTSRYNIKIHLYLICHFGYHRKCILPRRRLQISYRSPRSGLEAVVGIIAEQVAKIAPKPKIIDPDEEPPGIGVVFKLVLVIPFL